LLDARMRQKGCTEVVFRISTNLRITTIPKGNAQFIMNDLTTNSALTAKFLVSKFDLCNLIGLRQKRHVGSF
ncbi:hypothetical protein MJT46_004237, partial [Ovis ammon polii x Ovis aries]